MSTFPAEPSAGQVASAWREIAAEVALLVRRYGRAHFSECVEQVARERLEARNEKDRREANRRNALKESGVWYGHQEPPNRPEDEPGSLSFWFPRMETFRGRIKLPGDFKLPPERPRPPILPKGLMTEKAIAAYREELKRFEEDNRKFCWPEWEKATLPLFDYIKKRGFPDEKDGDFPYEFEVGGWLPPELSEKFDPDASDPLPPADRILSLAEKTAGLSAIHDAHLPSEEKIHPWTAEETSGKDLVVRKQAYWYGLLVYTAEKLGPESIPEVRLWLADVAGGLSKAPERARHSREPSPDGEPPDGPEPPDGFNYAGKTYRGLARKPFLAMSFLWGKRTRTARRNELAEPVWGDAADVPDENGVHGLRKEINRFFTKHRIAWHAEFKTDYLCLKEGSSPRSKAETPRKRRKSEKGPSR